MAHFFKYLVVSVLLHGLCFAGEAHSLLLAPIAEVGAERLAAIKQMKGITWWVEMGDHLLLDVEASEEVTLRSKLFARKLDTSADEANLYFVQMGEQSLPENCEVIHASGRLAVVRTDQLPVLDQKHLCRHEHHHFLPFEPNTVLLRNGANYPRSQFKRRAEVQSRVDQVDVNRWFADVSHLASINRYTRGTQIAQARDWLVAQFSALPNLQVSTPSFQVGSTTAHNVIAYLEGTSRPDEWYVVGAHYDSTSENPDAAAPGAEDNASGAAAVLEMARIFAADPPQSSVFFICYSGEEQGLHGSSAHASGMVADGDADKFQLALIMDMIAYASNTNDLLVLLETNNTASFMFETMIGAAEQYTQIGTRTSLHPFGSDHMPYLNRGLPALLTIENDWDVYPAYHRTNDLPANIVKAMGEGIIQMNVATLALYADQFAEGTFLDYVASWSEPYEEGSLVDYNGNGRIDIIDLMRRMDH